MALALRSDPRIGMAQANLEKARAALSEAHDAYIPSAGISGGDGKSSGVPTSLPVVFSISAQSLLFTFSQRDYIRAAHAGVDAASLSLDEAREQVMEDVATTYISLRSAEARRDATMQEYGFAARLVSITEDRLAAGDDTRMELLRNRRTADSIRLEEMRGDDEVAELSDHLARLIGLPGNTIVTVPSSIPNLVPASAQADVHFESPGVQSEEENVRSKQETAFGEARYRFRPQISFGANYSRISIVGTNYTVYYPGFANPGVSLNSLSLGAQIQIPFYDKGHQDRARGAVAEAHRVALQAANDRNQFLEGRLKLSRSTLEAGARADLAKDDVEIATAQIDAVLAQLGAGAADPGKPQLNPKDEQNARLQERQRYVEMLNAQLELSRAEISLLRQTGQLGAWLETSAQASPLSVLVPSAH